MSFDERQIEQQFKQLDFTQFRIKQLANQFLFFREGFSKRLIDIWRKHFHSSNPQNDPQKQINLMYVLNEIIVNSSIKNKIDYIKGFGDVLRDLFEEILK